MLKKSFSIVSYSLLSVLLITVISCGKKTGTKSSGISFDQSSPPITSAQELVCEQGKSCPSYIAKVTVVNGSELRICTGFLVNSNIIATSTSCLTSILRLSNQDCSQDVFFYLPNNFNRSTFKVGCKRVLQVSQLNSSDPSLWRDDVSFLELEEPIRFRRPLSFSRDGLEDSKTYTSWAIEQVDKHTAFIRKLECEAVHKSYVNPLASHISSPNMVFAGCDLKPGHNGAPIVDERGRVRGMISQPMNPKLRSYIESTGLLSEPLRPMFHATNFACAPLLYNTDVLNERECTKELNYQSIDSLRANMLTMDENFEALKISLEERLSQKNLYFNVGVKLSVEGDVETTQFYPKCFKNVSSWISNLNISRSVFSFVTYLPKVSFQKVMNGIGHLEAREVEEGEKKYYMQFSPRSLKNFGFSRVFLWNNDDINQTFDGISEACH
jgi:hypothetical protein